MRVTVTNLREMKQRGEPITELTAYDFQFARILDDAGVDILLVGDSAGNVMLGYENTLPVTMDEMIILTRAVVRATRRAFVIFDMPFLSYQTSVEDAVRNAGRAVKETGCQAVKLEGGGDQAVNVTRRLVETGIPVQAHLGLTPQSVHQLGGFKVQGKEGRAARAMLDEALRMQDAGAFSLVLECVPSKLANILTERLDIPTIGIGAGAGCDGQVLVVHDMLNMSGRKPPKFVKVYADIEGSMKRAVKKYVKEVRDGSFPKEEHTFKISDDVVRRLQKTAKKKKRSSR